MSADGPEVLLMAAWVCWAAAGLLLDQGVQGGSHIVKTSGRGGHGATDSLMEDRYPAQDQFLTPGVMGLDVFNSFGLMKM